MARITREEIETTTEMFVNSIYDEGEQSGWLTASLEDWMEGVYKELVTWKTEGGCSYESNENRFVGREEIMKKIKPVIVKRLKELKEEGYAIKAL